MEIQVFDQEEPFGIPQFESDPEFDTRDDKTFDTKLAMKKETYGLEEAEDQMILYAIARKNGKSRRSLKQFIKDLYSR